MIYPGDAELSPIEKSNICYLAFPDSNSCCTGDTNYFFRLRRSIGTLTEEQWQFTASVPIAMQPDPKFYFGFVHFRQQKDPTLPRGYFQKVQDFFKAHEKYCDLELGTTYGFTSFWVIFSCYRNDCARVFRFW